MSPGEKITLSLAAGQALTVTVPSGATGTLTRLQDSVGGGDPFAPVVLSGSDVTVGPFASPRRYMLVCSTGAITYSSAPSVAGGSLPNGVVVTDDDAETVNISQLGYNFDAGNKYVTIQPVTPETTDEAGWGVQVFGGEPNGTASGGGLNLEGGDASGGGNGGGISIAGGYGEFGTGGSISIAAGAGVDAASKGSISIYSFKNLIIEDLPMADPEVENALWNDAGTLKISAG